jgi:iron complex transport system permease protein
MLFWLMGDLNDAQIPWMSLVILLCGLSACLLLSPSLNLLYRGEKEAQALGLATRRIRLFIYLLSSLLTAAAVIIAGCIGFVGLLVPHLARKLAGHDHRLLLPTTVLLGGSIVTLADTAARTLAAPQQLPVGMLLSLIGVPVFIWLIQCR